MEAACFTAVKEGRAVADDWFPNSGPMSKHNIEARRICIEDCAIQHDCLIWALQKSQSHYGLYGIWGGSMPLERRRMVRGAA